MFRVRVILIFKLKCQELAILHGYLTNSFAFMHAPGGSERTQGKVASVLLVQNELNQWITLTPVVFLFY